MINLKGSRFTMSFFFMLPILLLEVTQVYSANSIRMQRDFRYPVVEDFPVYWNVPTFMCHKHGINFQQHTQRFGITANHGDQFRGDYINILYDPGLFPAMLRSSGGKSTERNGGIPQLGNLTRHLESFRDTVEKLIPANFSGVAIIDFESWRPVFRQNWNYDDIYKRMSKDLVRQQHPYWKESKIENQAQKSFEYSAKAFMDTTLKLAKLLRPRAKWGYYGFPYCYNYRANNNMEPWCPPEVEKENNKIQWLFDESTAIYPSIYLSRKLEAEDHRKFVLGRLNEAWRVTSRVSSTNFPHVYPYIWYKYYDSSDFLTEKDLQYSLETSRKYKMGGAIIWGATNDVITKEKCLSLLTYLNRVLGPTVVKVKRESAKKQLPESQYEFVPLVIVPSNSNSTKKLNYSYQVVKRDETSSPTTTSATPRLKRIADWYEKMLKYMFSFNLEYPKDN